MDRDRSDLVQNRELWTIVNAQHTDDDADDRWERPGITWGLFRRAEDELGLLGEVAGRDVLELGCGTAYLSAGLARAGARPVAVDLSPAQLATARRCQERHGLTFPLIEADAADVPLADATFDLVVSEYGAGPWCDPARWLPEAARILRPGGRLVFLTNSVLAALCVPAEEGFAGDQLLRPQRDLACISWPGGGTEHHPGHGDWIRELRTAGFVVDALHELYPDTAAIDPDYYVIADLGWATRWPAEDVWVAHLGDDDTADGVVVVPAARRAVPT